MSRSLLADQGPIASRPAAGVQGRFWWATDEGVAYIDTGTEWERVPVFLGWRGDYYTGPTANEWGFTVSVISLSETAQDHQFALELGISPTLTNGALDFYYRMADANGSPQGSWVDLKPTINGDTYTVLMNGSASLPLPHSFEHRDGVGVRTGWAVDLSGKI